MSETLRLTVVYEDAGDGWVMASIAELPAVLTQGATIDEVRTMSTQHCATGSRSTSSTGDRPETCEGTHSEPLDVVTGA